MPHEALVWACDIEGCSVIHQSLEVIKKHEKNSHNIKCVVCGRMAETPIIRGELFVHGEPWCEECINKGKVKT